VLDEILGIEPTIDDDVIVRIGNGAVSRAEEEF